MDASDQFLDYMCRTCMNELDASSYEHTKPQQQWQYIFGKIEECGGSLRISELLSSTVPQIVNVQLSDELPKKICCKCLHQLLSAYRFQQMCLQSEKQMRALVSKQRNRLNMSIMEEYVQDKIQTKDKDLCSLTSYHHNSTLQNVQQLPKQEPFPEGEEQLIEPEVLPSAAFDYLPKMEDLQEDNKLSHTICVKNEPIEDDEPNIQSSDAGIMHTTDYYVKDDALSIESEEIQTSMRHKTVHDEYEYKCDFTTYFSKKSNLKKHKLIHSGERPYRCVFCEKRFIQSPHLLRHLLTHNGEKPYKCKYCDSGFASKGEVVAHLRTHLGAYTHRCELCSFAFSSDSELRSHSNAHKDEDTETRERNIKALREEEAKLKLKFSKKEPTDDIVDRPFKCPYCPQKFPCSETLSTHKMSHERFKRLACNNCGKSFRKYDLKIHKQIHIGEKSHMCHLCEKRFTHIQYLNRHMQIHTGEKPYKCKYCERDFTSNRATLKHVTNCPNI